MTRKMSREEALSKARAAKTKLHKTYKAYWWIKLAGRLRRRTGVPANPATRVLISAPPKLSGVFAWDAFVGDEGLRKIHDITDQEMETLSRVAKMGDVRYPRDFIFILNAIRQALGR